MGLASRFSQHPFVPFCYRIWLAYYALYPEFFGPETRLPFPAETFPYNKDKKKEKLTISACQHIPEILACRRKLGAVIDEFEAILWLHREILSKTKPKQNKNKQVRKKTKHT